MALRPDRKRRPHSRLGLRKVSRLPTRTISLSSVSLWIQANWRFDCTTPANAHMTDALQLQHCLCARQIPDCSRCSFKVTFERLDSVRLEGEIKHYVTHVVPAIPVSSSSLEQLKQEQESDAICSQLRRLASSGWPSRRDLSPMLKEYWFHKDSIPEANSVLMFGLRTIVRAKLQSLILHRLHEGHFGVDKCRERAKDSGQVANNSCQPKKAQQSLPYVPTNEDKQNDTSAFDRVFCTALAESQWTCSALTDAGVAYHGLLFETS